MLRVVFCFMSANMRAHMCLIRQGRCGARGVVHTSNLIGEPARRCFVCAPLANDRLISTKGLTLNGLCYRTGIEDL
jgi:hypothetical protein